MMPPQMMGQPQMVGQPQAFFGGMQQPGLAMGGGGMFAQAMMGAATPAPTKPAPAPDKFAELVSFG